MGSQMLAASEFTPPGAGDFNLPPIFGDVTKPMLLLVLSVVIISVFLVAATSRLKIVPSKFQFVAESIYDFGRNSIAREQIGSKDFLPYVPFVFSLFIFVLVNNLFGLIPFIQFPTMSHIGFPLALAAMVYVVYHTVGFRKRGFVGYIKHSCFPPGAPTAIYLLLAPIEFFSKFVMQPITLAIRVFAAMFAGHLILLVFTAAGEYLLVDGGWALKPVSLISFLFAIAMTFLEALVQVLQAYIFALLAASYIGSSLAEEH